MVGGEWTPVRAHVWMPHFWLGCHLAANRDGTSYARNPSVRYKRPSSRLTGNFEFFCYFLVLDVTKDRWRSINGTLGVDRTLICGGNAHTVPYGLVEDLMQAADRDGTVCFNFH